MVGRTAVARHRNGRACGTRTRFIALKGRGPTHDRTRVVLWPVELRPRDGAACARGESNPHASRHRLLRPACLPEFHHERVVPTPGVDPGPAGYEPAALPPELRRRGAPLVGSDCLSHRFRCQRCGEHRRSSAHPRCPSRRGLVRRCPTFGSRIVVPQSAGISVHSPGRQCQRGQRRRTRQRCAGSEPNADERHALASADIARPPVCTWATNATRWADI